MMGFGYGMGSLGGFGWLGALLFLALIGFGVTYLWRAVNPNRPHPFSGGASGTSPASQDSALSILRERYARGELDKEEYDRRKEGLA